MRYRTLTAALTAAALIYSPAPSFAQTAPLPAVSQEEGLELAHGGEHRNRRRLLLWLILGGVAAAIAAYLLLRDGDEEPISP